MNSRAALLVMLPALGISASSSINSDEIRVRISGTVFYRGEAASAQVIDMSVDTFCASHQAAAQATDRSIFTGSNSGLQDVVVFIGADPSPASSTPDNDPPVLDQQGCMYHPRLIAMHVDQPLVVRNSDGTLHNVHVYADANRGFNIGQPFQGLESQRRFTVQEVGMDVRCDIHRWMRGSIAVFEHPFFAVTTSDGHFDLDLPPGTYEVVAWHPELGSKTQSVTVSGVEAPPLAFEF